MSDCSPVGPKNRVRGISGAQEEAGYVPSVRMFYVCPHVFGRLVGFVSFAPSGLFGVFGAHPRLAPWAAFLRRVRGLFFVVSVTLCGLLSSVSGAFAACLGGVLLLRS